MRMIVKQLVEWRLAGETEVLEENLPQRHFVHHKSHMTRPGAAAVGSQRLTAWAMAQPQLTVRWLLGVSSCLLKETCFYCGLWSQPLWWAVSRSGCAVSCSSVFKWPYRLPKETTKPVDKMWTPQLCTLLPAPKLRPASTLEPRTNSRDHGRRQGWEKSRHMRPFRLKINRSWENSVTCKYCHLF
jgi:hypothetical protein